MRGRAVQNPGPQRRRLRPRRIRAAAEDLDTAGTAAAPSDRRRRGRASRRPVEDLACAGPLPEGARRPDRSSIGVWPCTDAVGRRYRQRRGASRVDLRPRIEKSPGASRPARWRRRRPARQAAPFRRAAARRDASTGLERSRREAPQVHAEERPAASATAEGRPIGIIAFQLIRRRGLGRVEAPPVGPGASASPGGQTTARTISRRALGAHSPFQGRQRRQHLFAVTGRLDAREDAGDLAARIDHVRVAPSCPRRS